MEHKDDYNEWENDAYYYKETQENMAEPDYDGETDPRSKRENEPTSYYDTEYLKKTKYTLIGISVVIIIITFAQGSSRITLRLSPLLGVMYLIESKRQEKMGDMKKTKSYFICGIIWFFTFLLSLVALSRE